MSFMSDQLSTNVFHLFCHYFVSFDVVLQCTLPLAELPELILEIGDFNDSCKRQISFILLEVLKERRKHLSLYSLQALK
jgi:hypothetical protein